MGVYILRNGTRHKKKKQHTSSEVGKESDEKI